MKTIFTVALLFVLICSAKSQTLNGIPIDQLNEDYIQIVGTAKFLKLYEIIISVEYGQIGSLSDASNKKAIVLDESGKPMSFNGMMGAVNFFANYGYQLEFAYPITVANQLVYHYVMRKMQD